MNGRVAWNRLLGAAFVLSWMIQVARCNEFHERAMAEASSSMYLDSLSPAGKEIWESIVSRSEAKRQSISLEDFRQLQIQCPNVLTNDDNLGLFMLFGSMQRPPISREDLVDLAKRQRESLNPIDVEFSTTLEVDFDSTEVPSIRRYVFRSDNRSLYLSSEIPSHGKTEHDIAAFDGTVVRKLSQAIDGNVRSLPTGVITKLDQRRIFFPDRHPFCNAMLINPEVDRGEQDKYASLALMAGTTVVYESPVDVEGERCLVIGNTQRQCYCSMDKGFAVVKNVLAELSFNASTGRFQPNEGTYELTNRDFVKVNDLVWLPKRSHYRVVKDGKTVIECSVKIEKVEVGTPIKAEVFSDLFAPGTFVQDLNQNNQRSIPTVEKRNSRNVKKPLWNTVLGVNVILIAIIGIVIWIRRSRTQS